MRTPRLIVLDADGLVAGLLRAPAAEHRWLLKEPGRGDTALSLVREAGPAVLLVRVDPAAEDAAAAELIAAARRTAPDVPVVAVSDAKLPDADRAAWTAALLDLGARYVLFPPLTRPVLEDVVSGLMAAAVARVTGAPAAAPAPTPQHGVVDLADGDADG